MAGCGSTLVAQRGGDVLERGGDHAEQLVDRLGAPREVDDQRSARYSRHATGENAHRRTPERLGAHRLGKAGGLPVDHRQRRLRSDVVGRQAGAARREHKGGVGGRIAVPAERRLDLGKVIGDDLVGADVRPCGGRGPGQRRPRQYSRLPLATPVEIVMIAAFMAARLRESGRRSALSG